MSYLELEVGTRCSWHRHQAKYNLFIVLDGLVGIKTQYGETHLSRGETFMVAPGEWHEFRVYEPSKMIEEMFVCYAEDDIEREKIGGKLGE